MALTPVVLALNASGLAVAQIIARALDAPLVSRAKQGVNKIGCQEQNGLLTKGGVKIKAGR